MTNLLRASRTGLIAGGLALLATGAAMALPAGAAPSPTLTVTPSTIQVGQSADIVATGCVGETDQSNLFVVFSSSEGGPGESEQVATDETGTATWNTGNAPEGAQGTYTILATCVLDDGETTQDLFEYDPATLTVVSQATTTTTAAPSTTTTAPAAARPATVTPAFTG